MKTWQTLLREHDPAADAQLPPDHAARMRRVVVAAAARETQQASFRWYQPLAMAALVVIMVGLGALIAERAEWEDVPVPSAAAALREAGERRQLQFVTPGGTRIIWVFDSEFELREMVP